MATIQPSRTPWHLWVVGVLSLLWNCYGGYDYVMSETNPAGYLTEAGYGPEVVAWVQSFPAWEVALWAIGVWGSVLGSLLLLLRSRFAATAFLVSLLGALGSFAYQLTSNPPAAATGTVEIVMHAVIVIVIILQWYYAKRQTAAGVLK